MSRSWTVLEFGELHRCVSAAGAGETRAADAAGCGGDVIAPDGGGAPHRPGRHAASPRRRGDARVGTATRRPATHRRADAAE